MSEIITHSQTPPGSVGPVPPDGISRAMSSGHLDTPRHLQGVWDQLLQKESPEQCHPDVWTLPDTSRECGTSSSRRNLQSNIIRKSGHSQTPPGSVGPVPPEGISRAMSSRHLNTPGHLQGVWDKFLQKESPGQCRPDVWTLPDTSRECGTSCSRRNLQSNVVRMSGHSQTSRECGTSSPRRNLQSNVVQTSEHSHTPPGSVGPVPPEGISGAMSSGCLDTPRPPGRVEPVHPEGISGAISSGHLHTPRHL